MPVIAVFLAPGWARTARVMPVRGERRKCEGNIEISPQSLSPV
jgi:hypothetical protein